MSLSPTQEIIKRKCEEVLDLSKAKLSNEYYYHSIVFCLIDSIFSIGVRYSSARDAVKNYCNYFQLDRLDSSNASQNDQHTINDFIKNIKPFILLDYGAEDIFRNKQKTSARNGILKAEAVYYAAEILKKNGINSLSDLRGSSDNDIIELEKCFKTVKGQSSGISFSYFLMLSGNDDYMKIDRWLERFVTKATGFADDSIYDDLKAVCNELQSDYPHLSPRLLDHQIWKYARKHLKRTEI